MNVRRWVLVIVVGVGASALYGWYGSLGCLSNECHAHAILSDSMQPAVPVGSIVIVRREAPTAYRVGDVISLVYPGKGEVIVTHRIVRVFRYPSGVWGVETKGDANANGDAWTTSLGAIIGRQVAVVPWVGYGTVLFHSQIGLVAVCLVLLSGVAFAFVLHLYRSLEENQEGKNIQ